MLCENSTEKIYRTWIKKYDFDNQKNDKSSLSIFQTQSSVKYLLVQKIMEVVCCTGMKWQKSQRKEFLSGMRLFLLGSLAEMGNC